jgi:hypothetical protein
MQQEIISVCSRSHAKNSVILSLGQINIKERDVNSRLHSTFHTTTHIIHHPPFSLLFIPECDTSHDDLKMLYKRGCRLLVAGLRFVVSEKCGRFPTSSPNSAISWSPGIGEGEEVSHKGRLTKVYCMYFKPLKGKFVHNRQQSAPASAARTSST